MKRYDVAIIGGGPAGLTAAIYARRANLSVVMFEGNVLGGTLAELKRIENYPGFMGTGKQLAAKMTAQVKKLRTRVVTENVEAVKPIEKKGRSPYRFSIFTQKSEFSALSVILAIGKKRIGNGVERDYIGKGASYCAVCDGFFYRDAVVAVYGSGNTAVDDAIYLSNIAKKVYLVSLSELQAEKSLISKLKSAKNVEILTQHVVKKLNGEEQLQSMTVFDIASVSQKDIEIEGFFVANGVNPDVKLASKLVSTDSDGILAGDTVCDTKGVFACGDAVSGSFKQVVTACATGAQASEKARAYLLSQLSSRI
ncbi:MAG: FAD-dependent oxidoreductase [Clostridia bacterium]|nr:FAD-dependent oxidoreductase [Clostridia bacterium]